MASFVGVMENAGNLVPNRTMNTLWSNKLQHTKVSAGAVDYHPYKTKPNKNGYNSSLHGDRKA